MEHENRCLLSFRSLFVSRAKSQLTPVPTWETWLVNYIQSRENGEWGGGQLDSLKASGTEMSSSTSNMCWQRCRNIGQPRSNCISKARTTPRIWNIKDTITAPSDSSLAVVSVRPHSRTVVTAASVSKLNLSPDESKWVYLVQLSQIQKRAQKPGSSFWLRGCESSQVQSLQPVNAKQEISWLSTFGHSVYQSGAKRFRFAEA